MIQLIQKFIRISFLTLAIGVSIHLLAASDWERGEVSKDSRVLRGSGLGGFLKSWSGQWKQFSEAYSRKDYEVCLPIIDGLIRANPDEPAYRYFKAMCHWGLGQLKTALQEASLLCQLDGHSSLAWQLRAEIAFDLEFYGQAAEYFHRALSLNPDCKECGRNLLVTALYSGDLVLAVQYKEYASEDRDLMNIVSQLIGE